MTCRFCKREDEEYSESGGEFWRKSRAPYHSVLARILSSAIGGKR